MVLVAGYQSEVVGQGAKRQSSSQNHPEGINDNIGIQQIHYQPFPSFWDFRWLFLYYLLAISLIWAYKSSAIPLICRLDMRGKPPG